MLENLKPAERVEAPKGWKPALEFDGTEGFAITGGVSGDQIPDFDQFLLEQGFSPDEYEIVGAPRTSRWQKYDGDWLTAYRFNFRRRSSSIDLPLLWKQAKSTKPKPLAKVEGSKALVVMLADFQIGKTDVRGGTQETVARLMASFDRLEKQFKAGKYAKIILADLGDIVEGFSNKADMAQTYGNDLSLPQQVDLAASLVWDILKRASKFAPVIYASVASNHCQFRINKQQVGKPGLDDWGTVIAQQIHRLSTEVGLDVKVLVPQPDDESLAVDVFDNKFHILGIWHGHQVSRPEAMAGWLEKQAFYQQPLQHFTTGISGHFHHARVQELGQSHNGGSRYWVQAKTSDAGSSWFRLNSGQDSTPGISCLELEDGTHYEGTVFHV